MNEMLLNFPRGEYAISVFVWDCIAIRKDGGGGRMTHRYALRPTGRRKRRCFAALNSNLIEGSRPSPWGICDFCVRMRLYCYKKGWWWGKDSNLRSLRRQIYSLLPLAAREPHHEIRGCELLSGFLRKAVADSFLSTLKEKMVVGEGLFVTSFLTLRAVAGDVVSLRSTRTLLEGSQPSPIQ